VEWRQNDIVVSKTRHKLSHLASKSLQQVVDELEKDDDEALSCTWIKVDADILVAGRTWHRF